MADNVNENYTMLVSGATPWEISATGTGLDSAAATLVLHSNDAANQVSIPLTLKTGSTATAATFTGTITQANKISLLSGLSTYRGFTTSIGWQLLVTPDGGVATTGPDGSQYNGTFSLLDNRLP